MTFQNSLFGLERFQRTINRNGKVFKCSDWLTPDQGTWLFEELRSSIVWGHTNGYVNGVELTMPRMVAWYSDENCHYSYGENPIQTTPWIPALLLIKNKVEDFLRNELPQEEKADINFNCLLANLYRGKHDNHSWHSYNAPELGKNPLIASISLGEDRSLMLKPGRVLAARNKSLGPEKIIANNGSLIVMSGELQDHWLHSVPKEKVSCGPQINLTFMNIRS